VDKEDSHGAAAQYREEDGRLLVGAAPRVWGSRAGGEDSIQGHAEAIRRASTAGRGGHGWRRPWGPPAPVARARDKVRKGKKSQGKGLTGGSRVAEREKEGWGKPGRLSVLGRKDRWAGGLREPEEGFGVV
jgi:hypothetical protein